MECALKYPNAPLEILEGGLAGADAVGLAEDTLLQ